MSFDIHAQMGTTPIRPQNRFDEAALAQWMVKNVEGFAGPLSVEQFKGGQSNPTYKLSTPQQNYVLRRKPSGTLLKSAHAIDREARVLRALAPTNVPIPEVYGICTDESVIGTWFFVMAMVEGRIFWDAKLPQIDRDERLAYFDAMNQVIADIHCVNYAAVKLEDYGRAGGFVARQIATWTKQYLADSDAGRDPYMDKMIEWLPSRIPANEETTLVHGDFRIDNLIFHPTEARVVAVLDWELSTLGNPLADFAYHSMMYRMPPLVVPGLGKANLSALNIPLERDYLDSYCRRTGRGETEHYDFYLAFNLFRFAAILHGIRGRYLRGTATNTEAKTRAEAFPVLAQMAWLEIESMGLS